MSERRIRSGPPREIPPLDIDAEARELISRRWRERQRNIEALVEEKSRSGGFNLL